MFDRMHVLNLWQNAIIMLDYEPELHALADKLISFKAGYYDQVEKQTNIPWYVVGALDSREESFDHSCYLGNGDPLSRPTRHVPQGRGPFSSWYAGAIDSLTLDGFSRLPSGGHWDIVTSLIKCESYNGLGYAHMGLPSPYVWALTNQQKPGKYISDGHFDHSVWDRQPGCAAIFLALKKYHGVDLREA